MDANTLQAVQVVVTALVGVIGSFIAYKTLVLGKKVDDIHEYTNSIQGKTLRDYATALSEKAVLTNSVTDKVVAASAKVDAAVHDLSQAKIDSKKA